jgi:hypothetical protein
LSQDTGKSWDGKAGVAVGGKGDWSPLRTPRAADSSALPLPARGGFMFPVQNRGTENSRNNGYLFS